LTYCNPSVTAQQTAHSTEVDLLTRSGPVADPFAKDSPRPLANQRPSMPRA